MKKHSPIRFVVETIDKDYATLPFSSADIPPHSTDHYLVDRKIFKAYRAAGAPKFKVTKLHQGIKYQFMANVSDVSAVPAKTMIIGDVVIFFLIMALTILLVNMSAYGPYLTETRIIICLGFSGLFGAFVGQTRIAKQRRAAEKFNKS